MHSRKVIALSSFLLASMLLTGCANESLAKQIQGYAANSPETVVTQKINMSNEDMTNAVYKFVTGNMSIDTNDLVSPTEAEEKIILAKIDRINAALRGKDNNSISDEMLNYMLWEFSKTQREWDVMQDAAGEPMVSIVGIDPATRKIFVDVTYQTTNNNKMAVPASSIIIGDPMEQNLKELRYTQYISYLQQCYSIKNNTSGTNFWSNSGNSATENNEAERKRKLQDLKTKFEGTWGSIDSVLEEQQERTLVERLRNAIKTRDPYLGVTCESKFYDVTGEKPGGKKSVDVLPDEALRYIEARGIGAYTYTGITKQTVFDNRATMRFRFILDFNYGLGSAAIGDEDVISASSVTTTSVYLMDYSLYDWEDRLSRFTLDGGVSGSIPAISPYIDRAINSYQQCVEESDYAGLYKLFGAEKVIDDYTDRVLSSSTRFKDWDKFYSDYNRYCYVSYDAYDYEVVGWEGSTIYVYVTRDKKIRGKGTNMTMPSYKEKALIVMTIDDESVYINNEVILNTTNVGEPLSMIKDTTGISAKIATDDRSFTAANEKGVLEALKRFSDFQLSFNNNLVQSTDGYIDRGVTQDNLEAIKLTMLGQTKTIVDEKTGNYTISAGYQATEKIMWLGTWASKSNVYCRVRVREYFICSDGDRDTESYIGLMNRNGTWYVVSYEPIKTMYYKSHNRVSDKSCLSHDYLDKDSTSDYGVDTGSSTAPSQTDIATKPDEGTTGGTTSWVDFPDTEVEPIETEPVETETTEPEPTTSEVENNPVETESTTSETESNPEQGTPVDPDEDAGGEDNNSTPVDPDTMVNDPFAGLDIGGFGNLGTDTSSDGGIEGGISLG